MFPATEPTRHRALRIATLAAGMAEKAVSLFYEMRLHQDASEIWVDRCRAQITAVLAVLEAERTQAPTPYWFGASIGHADIMVAAALRFLNEAHAGLVDMAAHYAVDPFAGRGEALPAFHAIQQAFNPPA